MSDYKELIAKLLIAYRVGAVKGWVIALVLQKDTEEVEAILTDLDCQSINFDDGVRRIGIAKSNKRQVIFNTKS